jgi:choline dehydrogenase-like flavoprotein
MNATRARRRAQQYDVCIVGSGAGGGMAAYALTAAGARVLLLEAGPTWDVQTDSAMLKWPYESPRRGASTPDRPFGEFDACYGGWTVEGEPYTTAPGERFLWWRARMLGGRTNHWGRISLRFGPDDFRRGDLDGLSPNWPITYDDLKPWYDRVDRLVGIFGSVEGLPNEPDGIFLPPPKPRCYELLVKQGCDRLGITCIPARLSILTQPLNGRAACHYCGQCGRGCMTHSNFSVPGVLLPPALETGRLEIRTDAMVREVTVRPDGLADGVIYIDRNTGNEERVQARVVVLAASACESARLLLNSRSSQFPQGLGNTSGHVGRHLNDTTGAWVGGFFPAMMDGVPHNEDGVGGMHLYMPWWLDNSKLDFPRGYHIEFGGGRDLPGYGVLNGIENFPGGGGWGRQLKEDYRRYYGCTLGFAGRGEMVSNENCYCEIDPEVVDRWGIPVLKFHWQWSDYERLQVRHMQQTFRALIHELGGTPWDEMPGEDVDFGLTAGGEIIHELGTTRMGSDPSTSVLNQWCQAHEVRNLFVTDGGPFVTQSDKNPTWTILALSWRTSEHISEMMRRREL